MNEMESKIRFRVFQKGTKILCSHFTKYYAVYFYFALFAPLLRHVHVASLCWSQLSVL